MSNYLGIPSQVIGVGVQRMKEGRKEREPIQVYSCSLLWKTTPSLSGHLRSCQVGKNKNKKKTGIYLFLDPSHFYVVHAWGQKSSHRPPICSTREDQEVGDIQVRSEALRRHGKVLLGSPAYKLLQEWLEWNIWPKDFIWYMKGIHINHFPLRK